MSHEESLYCDASQERYYLIPTRLVCADGPLIVYDLAGKATKVRATSLAPFEIAPEAVRAHLDQGVKEWLQHLEGTADGPALARGMEQAADTLLARMARERASGDEPPTKRYRRAARRGIARSLRAHGIACPTSEEA